MNAAAALLALILAGPAIAAEQLGETPKIPSLPVVIGAPSAASLPSLPQAPSSSLSQPSRLITPAVTGSPSAAPVAAETPPRPAGASAGLNAVAASVQKENAKPSAEAAPSPASRAFFDGGLGKAVRATAVVASAATPGGLGMPAAYALSRYAGERSSAPSPKPAPWTHRAAAYADAGAGLFAAGFAGMLLKGALGASSPAGLALALAVIAFGASRGMEQMVARSREVVVGGWQASHDQKYRVDPGTGRLKDVRGHKYGSDRYEEKQDGPVSSGERLAFRLAAVAAGAALLPAWTGLAPVLFSVSLASAFALSDFLQDRRPPARERVLSDEERDHASRFRH